MRRSPLILVAFLALAGCQSKSPESIGARIEGHLVAPAFQAAVPADHASIAERLKFYGVPGVSVAVIDHDRVAWAKGFGVADLQTGRGVDEHTLFHGASLSKTANAITAMTLVQEGKLDLDKPVNDQLKAGGWKLGENEFTKQTPVTLRRLLSHSAGMNMKYMGLGSAFLDAQWPSLTDVLNGAPPATQPVAVVEKPGARFVYSGGAIAISQLMVQEACGDEPYPKIVKERVFDKLGMTETTFEPKLPDDWMGRVAPGFKAGKRVNGPERVYPAMSAAGIWTTPEDYAKIVIEILHAANHRKTKVLSSGAADAMMTPWIANGPNPSGEKSTVGLGVFLTGGARGHYFFHAGSHAGYSCYYMACLETGQGVVVMTNGDAAFDLIGEIVETVAKEESWPAYHYIPPGKAPATQGPAKTQATR